jgi:hypothetical protein
VGLEPSRAQPLNSARFNEPDLTDAEWASMHSYAYPSYNYGYGYPAPRYYRGY